jgi:hypothetical protein
VVPYQYSMIVWAAIFGYLVFGDVPFVATIIGVAIIIAAGLYIFLREQELGGGETVVNSPARSAKQTPVPLEPMSQLGHSRGSWRVRSMSGYRVNLGNAGRPVLPVEGVGFNVIQAPKREPRTMRYELTDFVSNLELSSQPHATVA